MDGLRFVAAALLLPAAPVLGAQSFSGTVRIAGQLADPGVYVQIVEVRADHKFEVCADTRVGAGGGYTANIDAKPSCRSAGDVYEFFVNGVWATNKASPFSPAGQVGRVNLSVPILALVTPDSPGVRLVWFYGTVADRYRRPAPPGLAVKADPMPGEADPGLCEGSGKTQDVFWRPKAAGSQPVNVKGFYFIGVETLAACLDRTLLFNVSGAASNTGNVLLSEGAGILVSTPPYGSAYHRDLVFQAFP